MRIACLEFGTGFSSASTSNAQGSVLVPNKRGSNSTPTILFVDEPSNVLLGEEAKGRGFCDPEKCISFAKRAIGSGEVLLKTKSGKFSAGSGTSSRVC